MSANLLPNVYQRFFDSNGNPLAGGKLYSYAAGTSTPLSTYTDESAGTPNANPVVLDSNGAASIWIDSSAYKFVLKDSSDVQQWSVDNVQWINGKYITAAMIADGVIGTTQLTDAAVTTAKIQDSAVTTAKIADAAVTSAKIASGAVGNSQLAAGTLTASNFASNIEVLFKNPGDFFADGKIYGVPQYNWASPVKLSDPSVSPPGATESIAWSPNGEFLAVGGANANYLTIYQRKGTTFAAFSATVTPSSTINGLAWSPNGKFLAMALNSSPYLAIFMKAGKTFSALPAPSTLPPASATGVAWSPNGEFLSVSHQSSPYCTHYQLTGGVIGGSLSGSVTGAMADVANVTMPVSYTESAAETAINGTLVADVNLELKELQTALNETTAATFTKISDPGTLPAGNAFGVAWSPSGSYVAVAHANSPYVSVYSISGTTLSKIGDPASLPTSEGLSVGWSPDESILLVGTSLSPYLYAYSQSAGAFSKISGQPAIAPAGSVNSIEFSPNGVNIAVGMGTTPYLYQYSVTVPGGTTLNYGGAPSTIPLGVVSGCAWSPDGQFLACSIFTSPYIVIYQTVNNTLSTNAILWTRQVNNV